MLTEKKITYESKKQVTVNDALYRHPVNFISDDIGKLKYVNMSPGI